ncbi:hypothetical protein [Streptomyces sp. SAJ15]|uniref:hypothetical protein n=1 Tax=Streptomyces sp. SAJ15 TaxID=2011095 RepID=UPI0037DA04AE
MQQRAIVADHHGAPAAPAGQCPSHLGRPVRKKDFRLCAGAQDIFRDPHGFAVDTARERVDDHE